MVAVGVVVVLLLAVVAGSCTKKGSGSGSDGDGAAADAFRAAIVRPATLDPAKARTVDELLVADQLFAQLTEAEQAKCVAEEPALTDRGQGHPAACHYARVEEVV